jgi:hypothetical protein
MVLGFELRASPLLYCLSHASSPSTVPFCSPSRRNNVCLRMSVHCEPGPVLQALNPNYGPDTESHLPSFLRGSELGLAVC